MNRSAKHRFAASCFLLASFALGCSKPDGGAQPTTDGASGPGGGSATSTKATGAGTHAVGPNGTTVKTGPAGTTVVGPNGTVKVDDKGAKAGGVEVKGNTAVVPGVGTVKIP